MGEFDLIARFFTRPARRAILGVGDDCALLALAPGEQMAISSDMLVEGRHFYADVDPEALGHKALAVNLSDLAACGAEPRAFTLALALPTADEAWLAPFARGLWALADAHGCELIGGDTTQGPLNLCITVFGAVPQGQALLRSGARPGDDVYVSGTPGDARLALQALRTARARAGLPDETGSDPTAIDLPPAALQAMRDRLERPTPRNALGVALRGVATACADVSDGLAGDLGHILKASRVGATLDAQALLQATSAPLRALAPALAWRYAASGGDDYELVFTAPQAQCAAVQAAAQRSVTPVTRIGRIEPDAGLRWRDPQGQPASPDWRSFDHFSA
ncbi:MAG: Thiamine-monophosphate kinase [Paracidovorax wautersii]|uniref:Thiamine-monophosphate kinase n=1 Tax=Paracidovorax wautersii TaxID=1177982 RepID=A0A7V8FNC4_9BURK|nr:MAG: Thiamine-monophosphate kinase [Paracidovorax wautersii]